MEKEQYLSQSNNMYNSRWALDAIEHHAAA